MKYDVLKDYDDIAEYPVPGSRETRKETVLSLKAGGTFIPAETHYPQNKVDALVANGTIKLIEKPKPIEPEPIAPQAPEPPAPPKVPVP